MASDYGCSATHSSSSLGEHTRMLGLRLCLYCSPAQDADQFLSHHIPKCHFACSVLQLQRWKKKVKSKHTYWHQNCDESVKKKNPFSEFDFAQQLQQTCYESIWSRSIRHPSYNVLVPALRFFLFLFSSESFCCLPAAAFSYPLSLAVTRF